MLKNAFFGSESDVQRTIRENNGGQESETISNDQSLSCEAEGCQFSKQESAHPAVLVLQRFGN